MKTLKSAATPNDDVGQVPAVGVLVGVLVAANGVLVGTFLSQ